MSRRSEAGSHWLPRLESRCPIAMVRPPWKPEPPAGGNAGRSSLVRSFGSCRRRSSGGAKRLIEGHYLTDTAPPAAREMAEISRPQRRMAFVEPSCQPHVRLFQRPHFDIGSGDERHGGVEGPEPANRKIGVDQLLQDFRRSAQTSAAPDRHGEEFPGRRSQRMWPSYRIHDHIRVDEGHVPAELRRRDSAMTLRCSSQSGSRSGSSEASQDRKNASKAAADVKRSARCRFSHRSWAAALSHALNVRPSPRACRTKRSRSWSGMIN